MSDLEPEIDLLMASLRADATDATIYFAALCTKLTEALGQRATVSTSPGKHHRTRPADRLRVEMGEFEYDLALDGGAVSATVRHVVRGVALRTDEVALADWLSSLVSTMRAEAQRSEATRVALERLLA